MIPFFYVFACASRCKLRRLHKGQPATPLIVVADALA
jgi:hypothetical protein